MKRIKQKWCWEIRCWKTWLRILLSQSSFESSHYMAWWQAAMFWAASSKDPHAKELKSISQQQQTKALCATAHEEWSCQQALRELRIESCPGWYLDFSLVWSFDLRIQLAIPGFLIHRHHESWKMRLSKVGKFWSNFICSNRCSIKHAKLILLYDDWENRI